ncbi:LOW QUALITY PROTEIN: hypothetical protein HID58_069623 [Brassica napus]|uniref:Uncharacterized protein n=1 Tax=Brassica napus TaxID=3708 RepID=A0ABQ7YWI7_BRANA|nr:LOW QUALITY PROTEIN: hypothetical protein HID58_069623 [Brassica napus]
MVDTVVMFMAKAELFMYVDPSNYWLFRPKQGPFTTKIFTGRTPCENFQKICDNKIQVSSIVHQKNLDEQLRIPESCRHKPFGQFPRR